MAKKFLDALTFFFLFTFFLIGCRKELSPYPEYSKNQLPQRGQDASSLMFAKWPQENLPLELKISEGFTNQEIRIIEEMIWQWEDPENFPYEFFAKNLPLLPEPNETNIQNFKDNEFGIYKSEEWFGEVNQGALALTQFFGYRKYKGSGQEVIELEHADIFVNYKNYSFRTEGQNIFGSFDLGTVLLHEIGHFLGLPHELASSPSIMAPSITMSTKSREPYPLDRQNLLAAYSLEGLKNFKGHLADDPGERVQGLLELFPDGQCHHYLNGQRIYSHQFMKSFNR